MINHRIRILSSLLIAFIIVNVYSNFSGIKDILANIKLPTFNLISKPDCTGQACLSPTTKDNRNNSFDLPAVDQITPSDVFPTTISPTKIIDLEDPTPTSTGFARKTPTPTTKKTPTKTPTKAPTSIPRPTKKPKPTRVPTLPPITSDVRPGSSLTEIFSEVGRRACFPTALLRAIQEKETGAWWGINTASSKVKIYNTYGWWINGTGDPCTGFGYHTQTGIIPQDSVNAGGRCRNAVGASGDIGVMGLLQVSEEEQTATRKYTVSILSKNIDRRVLFDNILIFAIATKNRVGNTPSDCNNWPDDVVYEAAEKHIGVGSCSAQNYCNEVVRLYKLYR